MEWTQFMVLAVTLASLFIWNRTEARQDARSALGMIDAIRQDVKDFHGRLCSLEARSLRHREKRKWK
jgi:hypothetical protein